MKNMRYGLFSTFRERNNLLQHPLSLFTKIALPLGLFLFALGMILFFAIGVVEGNMADGRIVLLTLVSQGAVWIIIGLILLGVANSGKRRLRHLKQSGKQFKAEIINLTPVIGINVGFTTITVRAECIYLNEQQQRCKVRSNMFIWGNLEHEKLQAEVYVDWNDPYNYAVEITQREFSQHQVDIDYT